MAIKWGIIGASRIGSRAFIPNLKLNNQHQIAAIAAKNLAKAKAYGAEHDIEVCYDNYEALIADPNLDAIYIAQPPIFHPDLTLAATQAGKAVLVEKPFAMTKAAAEQFLAEAPKDHLAWEALVFAFHPQTQNMINLKSELGRINHIYSHFIYTPEQPDDYRKDASLGGGALHDVGTYSLRAAQLLMGTSPKLVKSRAIYNELGANCEGDAYFEYPGGATFHMHWSNQQVRDKSLVIEFESSSVVVEEPFHPIESDYILIRQGGKARKIFSGTQNSTWQFAIDHIGKAIRGEVAPIHQIKDFSVEQADLLEQIDRHSRNN